MQAHLVINIGDLGRHHGLHGSGFQQFHVVGSTAQRKYAQELEQVPGRRTEAAVGVVGVGVMVNGLEAAIVQIVGRGDGLADFVEPPKGVAQHAEGDVGGPALSLETADNC